jgi:cyanophycinase
VLSGNQRGSVIPIGGAEEKIEEPHILRKFVEICGGENAVIAVIPTASQLDDTGPRYIEIFNALGVKDVVSLPINQREDAQNPEYLLALEKVTGIFITGGNQLRLSTILGGTPVNQAIRKLNAAGVHVAGTSAGAAIMPAHMIAGGATGVAPTEDGVTLAPGLGLTNELVIDQHFNQRNRLGRLLTAISYNPFVIGIGLDEDTAVFISPDHQFEVVGSGGVTVIDAGDLTHSSMAHAYSGDTLTILGLKLHVIAEGGSFDINKREAFPAKS